MLHIDENLSIQQQNKTPQKRGTKRYKMEGPKSWQTRNHQMGQTARVHEQIKYSNLVAVKSISNKERQGTPKITINS
jgi:hypothetical protein